MFTEQEIVTFIGYLIFIPGTMFLICLMICLIAFSGMCIFIYIKNYIHRDEWLKKFYNEKYLNTRIYDFDFWWNITGQYYYKKIMPENSIFTNEHRILFLRDFLAVNKRKFDFTTLYEENMKLLDLLKMEISHGKKNITYNVEICQMYVNENIPQNDTEFENYNNNKNNDLAIRYYLKHNNIEKAYEIVSKLIKKNNVVNEYIYDIIGSHSKLKSKFIHSIKISDTEDSNWITLED